MMRNLRDARVHYYYLLLERYLKHVFVAGLVTGDFFFHAKANSVNFNDCSMQQRYESHILEVSLDFSNSYTSIFLD